MTFFDTIQKSFVDVPVDAANDNAIHTSEFLDASESLTTLFGMSLCPPSKRQQAAATRLSPTRRAANTVTTPQMSWAPLPSSPSSLT